MKNLKAYVVFNIMAWTIFNQKQASWEKGEDGAPSEFETLCAIWYHLYKFENVKNTHGGVLLLIKFQLLQLYYFTKLNIP